MTGANELNAATMAAELALARAKVAGIDPKTGFPKTLIAAQRKQLPKSKAGRKTFPQAG